MNEYKEFSAKTVDEAIANAIIALETSSDHLDYEIIEQGSTGFLGIGSKPAVIKARKQAMPEFDLNEKDQKEAPKKEKKEKKFNKDQKKEKTEIQKDQKKLQKEMEKTEKQFEKTLEAEDVLSVAGYEEEDVRERFEKKPAKEVTPVDIEPLLEPAKNFLNQVFDAMGMTVQIDAKPGEEINTMDIELSGDDMGVLIGKRGQTLDSLQYLTSIIVNAEQNEYIRVKVDTENYRSRRKDTLENLGKNIAAKVKRTNKSVSLEPMNPYERRIIHSVLQKDKYVDTHSEGEEPYRKVVVTPNKNCRELNKTRKPYGNKRFNKR